MTELEEALSLLVKKLEIWMKQLVLMLPNLFIALVLLVVTFYVARQMRRFSDKLLPRVSHSAALNNLFATMVQTSTLLLGVFFVLTILKLDKTVTTMLAGVGIIGLALGFAFQDIAANFISGVIIAVRKPFGVGDVIETNEYFGTIERINMRTIDLRRVTGELVKVPNRKVFENAMIIYTHYGLRRIDIKMGVSYAEDLERVQDIVKASVTGIKGMIENREVEMVYEEFGESSVNFLVRFWIQYKRQTDFVYARSAAIIKIKKAFDDNHIQIPFPIRTLDFAIKGGESLNQQLRETLEETRESNRKIPSQNGKKEAEE
ncbi:mechanosensitive ion channel family protein [Adhaeribacter radiodurans]|uniref:Mechanosensitive ion channel family protein n=1 Tax=Adhaeribacter radiodurans TaxID=2745197 RepID=A0A7L7LDT5_9BACT|nr:mechanosensitive ion channel family protein [Adhaeribacter radiodurans]QMU30943.1 mechanosensitive ion channel family protein [Adhaeribacter radiodurans]